ncbi:MAG: AAA family ATPase, partial [bacterium]
AKTLSRVYFGDEKLMIRLDMSEYQQADSISRLLGSPDGSTKGVLTEAVRNRPFALILLDEIEKAHQDILLTFLQVLDDGRLTDSSGITVDFTNTIIIATSNVGTRSIQEIFGRNGTFQEMKEVALREVREKFAPEFLNRFNGIIVYQPLSPDSVRQIAEIMLDGVRKNAHEKGVKISFKPALVTELVKRGYSPEWGARPMARVIEESVMNHLAVKILSKEIITGDSIELGPEVF